MGFRDPIIGGGGALVYPAIKSPNFVQSPLQGWSIDKNGNAYFQTLTVGGGVVKVTFASSAPSSPNTGDVWFDLANGTVQYWNGTAWTNFQYGSGAIQAGAIGLSQLASAVTAVALGGITTTIAGTAPGSPNTGDIWIDSANGYQLQRWSGSAWVAVSWNAADVISAATITGSLIVASTITGGLIAAGTITASNIQAATITSSLIASGAIVAGLIDANALDGFSVNAFDISGSQIQLTGFDDGLFVYNGSSGTPLNLNPNFATGITDWTAQLGSISYSTPTINGHDTMLMTPPGGAGTDMGANSGTVAVTAGSKYLASFTLQAGAGSGTVTGYINWETSGGALISSSPIVTNGINSGGWTTFSAIVTAPATAAKASVGINVTRNPSDSTFTASAGQALIQAAPPVIAALCGATINDPVGGVSCPQGLVVFGSSRTTLQAQLNAAFLNFIDSVNAAQAPGRLGLATVSSTNDSLQLNSPAALNTDIQAFLNLVKAASGGTALAQLANAALNIKTSTTPGAPANGTTLYVDSNGKLAQIPQAGTAMMVPGAALATFPGTTVTQAALTDLGTATIPANDAEAGSVYELEVEGNYTQATGSGTTLQLGVSVGGVDESNQIIAAANVGNAGGTGRFVARVRATCVTTGSGGTWRNDILVTLTPNASPGSSPSFCDTTAATLQTLSTTAAQALALRAKWGTTTGSPSITNRQQIFKRIA